jgi:ribosome-associated protein
MDLTTTLSITDIITEALHDLKAQDVAIIDVGHLTTITDYMIVASGTSKQHVRSIARHTIDVAKSHHIEINGVEGTDVSEWVLIDLGDAVVHVMTPEIRKYYEIEKLWNVDDIDEAAS